MHNTRHVTGTSCRKILIKISSSAMNMSNTSTNTMMVSYFQKRRVRPPTAATELPESVLAQCPPKIIL